MLLATLLVLALVAAIFAVTQIGALITVLFVIAVLVLAYKRLPLLAFSVVFTVLFIVYSWFGDPSGLWKGLLLLMLAMMWLFNIRPLRKALISRPFLKTYLRLLPTMSPTEREALEAGTVWWDGELFTGKPEWSKLLQTRPAQLSAEEQAFLDGPCEELCAMVDDFDVTHRRADLPPQAWDFIKSRGFLAMIIPKKYGGLQLGTYAQSSVLIKLASRSIVLSTTVAVPNSLGPGELLAHYGTEEQKNHFLPRLARGEEIPCFALTSPTAGSDAASISDTGIVCRGMYQGREVLGLKLNFSKRYITLAPVATLIGLAFRMFDPERLLGGEVDIGITCALLPRGTPGITIGRRHFPLNIPFQNGPIQGKDVFVPLDAIIGGVAQAGHGWRMLIEQLVCGPVHLAAVLCHRRRTDGGVGHRRLCAHPPPVQPARGPLRGSRAGHRAHDGHGVCDERGALGHHRRHRWRREARRAGGHPQVPHHRDGSRGQRRRHGRAWRQGRDAGAAQLPGARLAVDAHRHHRRGCQYPDAQSHHLWPGRHPLPSLRAASEMQAARSAEGERSVDDFDRALFAHLGFSISNAVRSLVMAVTYARFESAPGTGPIRRYYQHIERFSASFAFATDVAMLSLGGYLKKKESLSARLGDVLSYLYLASMVLKQHHDAGSPAEDQPIVEWACRDLLYRAQEQLHGFLRNFPNRLLAMLLRALIFPRGRTYSAPSDKLGSLVAELAMTPSPSRERLCRHAFRSAFCTTGRQPAGAVARGLAAGAGGGAPGAQAAHRWREDRQGHGAGFSRPGGAGTASWHPRRRTGQRAARL